MYKSFLHKNMIFFKASEMFVNAFIMLIIQLVIV